MRLDWGFVENLFRIVRWGWGVMCVNICANIRGIVGFGFCGFGFAVGNRKMRFF